jgi:phage terminase large subunit GpA-like protein
MERFDVWASKGLGGPGSRFAPLCPAQPARNNSLRAARFDIGTPAAKNQLFYRLRVDKPGPRYVHFPLNDNRGCDLTYFEQLTAERLIAKRINGQIIKVWEIPEGDDFHGVRNETLDCLVGATAAIFRKRPHWVAIKKRMDEQVDAIAKNLPAKEPAKEYVLKDPKTETATTAEPKPTGQVSGQPARRLPRRQSSGFVGGWRK